MGSIRCEVDTNHGVTEIHKIVVFVTRAYYYTELQEFIHKWECSDPGQFVLKHTLSKPIFNTYNDFITLSDCCVVTAELEKSKLVARFTSLKWKDLHLDTLRAVQVAIKSNTPLTPNAPAQKI